MSFDVVIVGGGPTGLSAAIRLKQLNDRISVCLIDKGAEVGAHTLSGAIMDPRALRELLPEFQWDTAGAPAATPVGEDCFLFLGEGSAWRIPGMLLPRCFHNTGNFFLSLSDIARWLGRQAEALGVEIFPGFAAAEVLYGAQGQVCGVATGDVGLSRDGTPGPNHEAGVELDGRYTLFAEGYRGHLGKQTESRFRLRDGADRQVYGLGIKELWQILPENHRPGLIIHTPGWPLPANTYGGSFLYHYGENLVAVGFVVGLGYKNPYLSPYEEFQRFKTHSRVREFLAGGRRLSSGARALTAGGPQSLPRLVFPGGVLIGDEASFLNASRIKGSHAAIKSGMLAAEAVADALAGGHGHDELTFYPQAFRASWLHAELHKARNFKPLMSKGTRSGAMLVGIDQLLLRGKAPWTLHNSADHDQLRPAAEYSPIDHPRPDGVPSFDRLSSVFLANTNHAEDQPRHLHLKDATVPIRVNLARYAAPEQRYCPAGAYEILRDADGGSPHLQINAQNCNTARPATSRIRHKTSTGSRHKVVRVRFIPACECSA